MNDGSLSGEIIERLSAERASNLQRVIEGNYAQGIGNAAVNSSLQEEPRTGQSSNFANQDSDERLVDNWSDEANCLGVDPDLFFPERGASTQEAKEVCRGCCVRLECLEYALSNGEKFGIWGGLSERERRRLRRQRALAARAVHA